jgi:hypothetical protein
LVKPLHTLCRSAKAPNLFTDKDISGPADDRFKGQQIKGPLIEGWVAGKGKVEWLKTGKTFATK